MNLIILLIVGGLIAAFTYLVVMGQTEPELPAQTPRRGQSAEPPLPAR